MGLDMLVDFTKERMLNYVLYGFRQEKLEQLAQRFDRKAGMRETWLSENQRLVSQDNFGYDLAAVEAATKKHEAIETDINAYEERVQAVVAVAEELDAERYHDIDRINARWAFCEFYLGNKLYSSHMPWRTILSWPNSAFYIILLMAGLHRVVSSVSDFRLASVAQ